MAKVQFLNRLRLAPSPAPIPTPPPVLTPIAPVQNSDQRSVSFPRGPAPGSRLSAEFVREIGRFAYFWGRGLELAAGASGAVLLYIRAYWPVAPINEGHWTPPAVVPA